ncbi:MFS family permease [Nocardia sp. GAS34]|uniref:MFS transporter n=1 Tax=unclassified Nocardia TaxID=2637762 RepID=UPI003D1A3BA3
MVFHTSASGVEPQPDPLGTDTAGRDRRTGEWRPICSLAAIVLVPETLALGYPMLATASPAIVERFHTAHGGWLMNSFVLVGAATAPLIGKLADLYGKRRILLICLVVSACGLLVSAIASTFVILLAGRCLSSVLVATVFLSYSLIRDIMPPSTIAMAVSIVAASSALSAIAAPFLSQWLLDSYDFRAVFWFLLILLGVSGAAVALTTDESPVRLPLRVGVVGAVLLGAGLALVLVGVSSGPAWGWTAASTLALLIGGVALIGMWVATARMTKDALIDLAVWRRRPVLLTAFAAGCAYGVSSLYVMLLPMLAMTPAMLGLGYGFGVDAQSFAVFVTPIGALSVIGGLTVGVLVGRQIAGPRLLLMLGMIVAGAGSGLTAYAHHDKPAVLIFAGLVGLGLGLADASIPNLLIAAVPTAASLDGRAGGGVPGGDPGDRADRRLLGAERVVSGGAAPGDHPDAGWCGHLHRCRIRGRIPDRGITCSGRPRRCVSDTSIHRGAHPRRDHRRGDLRWDRRSGDR